MSEQDYNIILVGGHYDGCFAYLPNPKESTMVQLRVFDAYAPDRLVVYHNTLVERDGYVVYKYEEPNDE